jgi:hypothetical protein
VLVPGKPFQPSLAGTNALAYLTSSSAKKMKSFIPTTPVACIIKIF